jgi:GTP-binding protein HflX
MFDNIPKLERAVVVGFGKKGGNRNIVNEHLNELTSLANTAGAEIIETYYQELESVNPATAIGKGKAEEIAEFISNNDIQLALFDEDLTPAQVKNLGKLFDVKIIDRSALILDIFARRAQSVEAKTQVELAQLQYMLPRLTRMWTHLSKQFGGIGTKGPGETQIETDRRIIKTSIQKLQKKLLEIDTQREQQRKGRENLPRFALVGYTNAGKSTLMNAITSSGVYVEDKLFATLDTTVRSFELPSGKKALLSDTVGFIRKLPANLVASFRSTLAEASEADFLIHIVDVSNPFFRDHIHVVNETLENLNFINKPEIIVFNKIDILEDKSSLNILEQEYPFSILLSASKGINVSNLYTMMQKFIDEFSEKILLLLPYNESHLLTKIYEQSDILVRNDSDDGYELTLKVNKEQKKIFNHLFAKYIVD